MAEPTRGCRVAAFALAGLIIGIMLGGLAGYGIGYLYVMTPAPGQTFDKDSTVAPLRESFAALSGLVGFAVGALSLGVTGGTIAGIVAYLKSPDQSAP